MFYYWGGPGEHSSALLHYISVNKGKFGAFIYSIFSTNKPRDDSYIVRQGIVASRAKGILLDTMGQ